jgi:hypothetical protein
LQNCPAKFALGFFFFRDSEKKFKKKAKKIAVLIFFPLSAWHLICSVILSLQAAVWLDFWGNQKFTKQNKGLGDWRGLCRLAHPFQKDGSPRRSGSD